MNTKHLLLAALLACAFAPATAAARFDSGAASMEFDVDSADGGEHGAAPEPHTRAVVGERFVIDSGDRGHLPHIDHSAFTGPLAFGPRRVVKNAPYSAEVISEQQHNLSDGNQILNKSTVMTYRDSAGRTRQETRDASGVVRTIEIRDAVAGASYILSPHSKKATRFGRPDMAQVEEQARLAGEKARIAGEQARAAGEKARAAGEKARERAEAMRHQDQEHVIVKRVERTDGDAGHKIREEVRIRVSRDLAAGHPMGGMDRFSPMIAGAFGDMKWSSKATTKDLGTKEIEGVKAQGKLRSYEIPAGEIGNRNPIVVSTESWYSPELQVTLLSRHSDPRSGERVYRVEHLKREEPAPALFAVPSDYTLKEVMPGVRKTVDIKK